MLMFASVFAWNFNYVYGDIDIDAENGYRIPSLRLHFVAIASITYKNVSINLDAKCEWA